MSGIVESIATRTSDLVDPKVVDEALVLGAGEVS